MGEAEREGGTRGCLGVVDSLPLTFRFGRLFFSLSSGWISLCAGPQKRKLRLQRGVPGKRHDANSQPRKPRDTGLGGSDSH